VIIRKKSPHLLSVKKLDLLFQFPVIVVSRAVATRSNVT